MSAIGMKRGLLLCALLVTLVASLAGPAGAADAAPASAERLLTLDQQILAGLNESRAQHGLRPLVMSSDLEAAAVSHSRAMLQDGFFAHDAPGGASFVARVRSFYRYAEYNSWSVGENLLYSNGKVTADGAIAAWLASPGHRENMLMPKWREVGIGSLRASSAGGLFGGEATWVVTMDFGTRSGKVERKATPTKVKKSFRAISARAKKSRVAARMHKAKRAKQTTRATGGAKPKKTPFGSKAIDHFLPQPSHGSDDESDDTADTTDFADEEQSTDAGPDEGEHLAPNDESDDDVAAGDGIDELAFRSAW